MFSPVKQTTLFATLCLTTTLFCSGQEPAVDHHNPYFITFSVANSHGTFPTSINNQLTVTGYSALAEFGSAEGFVRDIFGKVETFKVGSYLTQPVAINGCGEIAGVYEDVAGVVRSFIRSRKGEVTTFNPGGDAGLTIVEGINDRGIVIGYYQTKRPVGPITNFLRYPDGRIVTFRVDDAGASYPSAINGEGEITGLYISNTVQNGGFLRSRDGHITTFEFAAGIQPLTINDSGTIAGEYNSPTGTQGLSALRTARSKNFRLLARPLLTLSASMTSGLSPDTSLR
jgi:hypothetical protein